MIVTPAADSTFRYSFYAGLVLTLLLGFWLTRLWGSENQVQLHSNHFLHQIEERDWAGAGKFLAANYRDDWGNDRALMITRLRLGLRLFDRLTITAKEARITLQASAVTWSGQIQVAGSGSEMAPAAIEEINRLTTPFEFRWEKQSWKPWDWKLAKITNSEFQLPAQIY